MRSPVEKRSVLCWNKSLHENIMELFTIRQIQTEADDDYLNMFNLRLQNMEIAGLENMLCTPQPK